jgi:hypothetical protein
MRPLVRLSLAVLALLVLSSEAFAQASITGLVRDTSGGVLPGVTVEASSPELIEKVRSAVTDSNGQYRIENLRPGPYVVTFSLTGFSTVKREGIELTGSFAATVNADLRVGTVSETITVTGESPVVDIVNAKRQATMTNETIAAVPTARLYHSLATLIPGVTVSGSQDVGGIAGPVTVTFAMRGGPGNEGRLTVDGLSLGASLNGTGVSYTVADVGNAAEVVFTTAGGLGESEVGGPAMNLVPRQGGNKFSGAFFGNWANDSLQTSNYTDAIRAAGLRAPNLLLKIWDVNFAIGGPVRKDRLWFFTAVRSQGNRKLVAGMFVNRNAGDVNAWTYVPDSSTQATDDGTWKNANVRMTWQASARNKFNFFWDEQRLCTSCTSGGNATTAPESRGNNHAPPRVQQATWSSPASSRLLLEAGWGANRIDQYGTQGNLSNYLDLIPVTELCQAGCAANGGIANLSYRSNSSYVADSDVYSWRASLSFVTGRNNAKIGYQGQGIENHFPNAIWNKYWMAYRFNNGAPFQFVQQAGPAKYDTHLQTHAIYAQDQFTLNRLTFSGGIRYDRTSSYFPEQQIGPNPFILVPTIIPRTDGTSYHDISPRGGVVYDVFGNGKTALKFNVGRYLAAADGSSITGAQTNPINRLTTSSGNRTWTDANGNFRVDCLVNGVIPNTAVDNRASGGDFCGQGNLAFGQLATPTRTWDPAILNGWGIRPFDWNIGVQVQQELLPRVSVDVGYFRRVFGNFTAIDNRAQSIFGQFQVTAPVDSRLPNGGGQVISGLYNVDPSQSGQIDELVQKADNFGTRTQHWNGVEVNFTARIRNGLTLQGGTSTGRTTTDSCEIRAKLPETAPLDPYCRVEPPFRTQVKGLASYTVPKVDVQVGTAFQSLPGGGLGANYAFSNAVIVPSLGRPLSGNAPNATVNLVQPSTIFGDRINQIDLRIGKVLRFAGYRTQFSVDLYNALNSSAIQTYNQTFIVGGAWLTPTLILPARFVKITAQLDF